MNRILNRCEMNQMMNQMMIMMMMMIVMMKLLKRIIASLLLNSRQKLLLLCQLARLRFICRLLLSEGLMFPNLLGLDS